MADLGQNILSSVSQNGSGMDLTAVVKALVDAETIPKQSIAKKAKEKTEATISAYGTLKGKVSDLQTSLNSIGSTTSRTPFSDSSKLFVSVSNESTASDFSADVTISQLAQGQVNSFDLNTALGISSAKSTSAIGQGTLTVTIGSVSKDIIINANNATVEGLQAELNKVTGVGAEVIDTGSGVKLLVKSETGSNNAISITTSATTTLNKFVTDIYASDGSISTDNNAVTQTRAAKDATMTIDGVTVTRSSNVITDLYPGHQLILTGVTAHDASDNPTESFSIGSANTTDSAKSRLEQFLADINKLKSHLTSETAKGLLGAESGALASDPAAQGILRRLNSLTTSPIGGYSEESIHLAEMGVRTKIDGTLELFDTAAFDKALAANPDVLDPIFNTKYSSSSSAFSVKGFKFDPPDIGSYDFSFNASDKTATLEGTTMRKSEKDGVITFQSNAANSDDPTFGLQVVVLDDSSSANVKVRYGVSLLDTLNNYATELLGTANATDNKLTIADREFELNQDISDADETLASIEEKVAELTARYNERFGAMEVAVNSFNKTGEYMKTLTEAWNNQNRR